MTSPHAQALLDAHVAFMLEELSGARLSALLSARIDAALLRARQLTLGDVVTRDMIKETARRYACDIELNMAVPELAGEIAHVVHSHPAHQRTTLAELVPDRYIEEWLDKALELRDLRGRLVEELLCQPTYSAMLADVMMSGLREGLSRLTDGANPRGVWKLGQRLMTQWSPVVEQHLEPQLRDLVGGLLEALLAESKAFLNEAWVEDSVRSLALTLWDQVRERPVSTFLDEVSPLDVEEFIVMVYEYWHSVRKTPFYATVIDAGIDAFFEKYQNTTLFDLLDEIGIRHDWMLDDAMRFAPHVFGVLRDKGLLEPMVRSELARFYASGEVERVLASVNVQSPSAATPPAMKSKTPPTSKGDGTRKKRAKQ